MYIFFDRIIKVETIALHCFKYSILFLPREQYIMNIHFIFLNSDVQLFNFRNETSH